VRKNVNAGWGSRGKKKKERGCEARTQANKGEGIGSEELCRLFSPWQERKEKRKGHPRGNET